MSTTLADVRYATDCSDGFGDSIAPRHLKGGSPKYRALQKARVFLREMADHLPPEMQPQGTVVINLNPAGPAMPGEASFCIQYAQGRRVFAQVTPGFAWNSASVMVRVGRKPYAVDGANTWFVQDDTGPQEVAQVLERMYAGLGG